MRGTAKVALGVIALVLALAMPAALFAQQSKTDHADKGWWELPKVQEALQLSPEQESRIVQLETEKQEKVKAARRAVAVAMRQMISALDSASVPAETVATRRAELEKAWQEHLDVTLDYWRSLRQQLTEEQWKELPNVAPAALRLGMLRVWSRQKIGLQTESED